MSQLQVILGTAQYGVYDGCQFNNGETVRSAINLAKRYGVTTIDSARVYPMQNNGTSEVVIGQAHPTDMIIDTKVLSRQGSHTPENLQESIDKSLAALGVKQVNILYLHMPDDAIPLADVCRGMNDIYKQGKFKHFGISNYTVPQIKEMLSICEEKGYIMPSVYQGQYSAIVREAEVELLPLLRQHNIAFYAHGAAAGGAFNKNSSRMNDQGLIGRLYQANFAAAKEDIFKVADAAEKSGLSAHSVALNWAMHHSQLKAEHGDAVIIGASRLDQLEETLKALQNGPLSPGLVELLDDIWERNKSTMPSFTTYGSNVLKDYIKHGLKGTPAQSETQQNETK